MRIFSKSFFQFSNLDKKKMSKSHFCKKVFVKNMTFFTCEHNGLIFKFYKIICLHNFFWKKWKNEKATFYVALNATKCYIKKLLFFYSIFLFACIIIKNTSHFSICDVKVKKATLCYIWLLFLKKRFSNFLCSIII
jgi:hypothetical protein